MHSEEEVGWQIVTAMAIHQLQQQQLQGSGTVVAHQPAVELLMAAGIIHSDSVYSPYSYIQTHTWHSHDTESLYIHSELC